MRGVWDSKEDIEKGNYQSACLTLRVSQRFNLGGAIREANVSGTFYSLRPSNLFILGSCTKAFVEVDEVQELTNF
jgi:hypothetical protein